MISVSLLIKLILMGYIGYKLWKDIRGLIRRYAVWERFDPRYRGKPAVIAQPEYPPVEARQPASLPQPAATLQPQSVSEPKINPIVKAASDSVVGATKTVYIEKQEAQAQPVAEMGLLLEIDEPVLPERDELPVAEDVEISETRTLRAEDVDEQDRFTPLPEPEGGFADDEFSSGLTFEEIARSMDVMQREWKLTIEEAEDGCNAAPEAYDGDGGTDDEELSDEDREDTETEPDENRERELSRAAQVLYKLQGTELLDCVMQDKTNAIVVGRLLDGYIDSNGQPLPKPRRQPKPSLAGFDINMYI